MLKHIGERGLTAITKLFNKCWNEGKIPKDWEIGTVIPIFKKGDRTQCTNYRGITLLSIPSKVYERVLEQRLTEEIGQHMDPSQSGFRKGGSIQDHIFTIKQLQERLRETGKNYLLGFVDLEKAFDRISRQAIAESLKQRAIKGNLQRAIASIYKETRNVIRTGNMESQEFVVNEGVRQGSVLSPTLFNMIMDDIIKEVNARTKPVYIGHWNLEPKYIKQCAFADDLVVFARNENELESDLKLWNKALTARNLKININKSKVMVLGRRNMSIHIALQEGQLEQVETYKYLGVNINCEISQEAEIETRIENASKLYHAIRNAFLWKKEVSRRTKMNVYKTVFVPVLTFGCESWVLTKRMKSRLQSMEMKYLRSVLGITRRGRIRNSVVREELGIEPIAQKIENCQLRWYGHLVRMSSNKPVKQVWESRIQVKRTRGRPAKTWNKNLEEIIGEHGVTIERAKQIARNKKEWRKFLYEQRESESEI